LFLCFLRLYFFSSDAPGSKSRKKFLPGPVEYHV
jgi:hypothetical protein